MTSQGSRDHLVDQVPAAQWRAVAAAASSDELGAALASASDPGVLVGSLVDLADRLESAPAPNAYTLALELAIRCGAGAEVVARRDALIAVAWLRSDPTEPRVREVVRSAEALAVGDPVRAAAVLLGAGVWLAGSARPKDAVPLAALALDLLDDLPGDADQPGASAVWTRAINEAIRLADMLADIATTSVGAAVVARVAALVRRAGREDLRGLVAISLGRLLVRLGDAESGLEVLRDWVGLSSTEDNRRMALEKARFSHAQALHQTGRFDQAMDSLRAHPWSQSGDVAHRLEVVAATVRVLVEDGRLTEALDLLDETEVAGRPLIVALRAQVNALLGRPSEEPGSEDGESGPWAQLAWLHRAVRVDPQGVSVPDDLDAAFAVGGLRHHLLNLRGDLALALDRPDEALGHYQAALDARLTPATVEGWQEPWQATRVATWRPAMKARAERAAREGRGVGADLHLRIATAQERLGQDPSAALDSAIDSAARRNLHATLVAALLALARRKERVGEPAGQWRPDLERAADILEGLRARLRDEDLQLTALTDLDDVYWPLLRTFLADGDIDGALRVLERAKSRALLDRAVAGAGAWAELGYADQDEGRYLRGEMVRALGRRLTNPWAADLVGPLKRRLATHYRTRRRSATGTLAAATPEQVRQVASGGTLVLHYFCSTDGISLVPVGPPSATPIPALELTPADVHAYLEVWRAEQQVRGESHSLTELYRALVAPVEPLLAEATRLLVVPHGVLHSVPFAALRGPDGRHLVERLPVMHAPSAALAAHAGAMLARPPGTETSVALGVELAGYLPLAALTNVPDELDAIEEALPDVLRWDRSAASRRALLELDGELDVLHFACHGEFDPDDPLLSRLYLADGPVYGYELLTLRAKPRLVVFSACETGRDERLPGDEAMGLVRPFLGGGAGVVVATLWEVPDASTTALMAAFYREYAVRRFAPASCLRTAQLELLGSERFAHPHYWAPYVAIGGYPRG